MIVSRSVVPVLLLLTVLCSIVILGTKAGPYVAMTPSGSFRIHGEYPTDSSSIKSARYASWSDSNQQTGTLKSAPFRAGFGIALAVSGYPLQKGEELRIEREDGTSKQILTLLSDPALGWVRVVVPLPLSWFGQRVRFVATDDSTALHGWVGISELRPASLFQVLEADPALPFIVMTMLSVLLFFPCLYGGMLLRRRAGLPNLFLFAATLLIAGIVAEALFFLTMINTIFAVVILLIVTAIGSWTTVAAFRSKDFVCELAQPDSWVPFALTIACAIVYLVCVSMTLPAIASPLTLLPFTLLPVLKLPMDNVLPHLLAVHIAAHLPPNTFVSGQSSDHPPLQTGFDLIISALAPFVSVEVRYEALSLLLQATTFGLIFTLCRLCNAGTLRSIGVVVLAAFTGCFFINTVYVWPKLLSASYMAIAVAIAIAPGRISLARSIGIGIATALALIAHPGVIFTIPALLVALVLDRRVAAIRTLVVAGACLLVVLAPQLWYQHVYDPPGDRLLKWHIAGHIPRTDTPFTTLLIQAYTKVPLSTIVANKESNFRRLWGEGPIWGDGPASYSDRQFSDFYFVRNAVGALALPYLAALLLLPLRRFRMPGYFAWIAAASLIFWCLAMYLPDSTAPQSGSYLTMMLICIAGGLIATEWWPLFAIVLVVQLYYFIHTWLVPLNHAINGVAYLLIGIVAGSLLWAVANWTSGGLSHAPVELDRLEQAN